jgi:TP901 family phage tail tape measure protein
MLGGENLGTLRVNIEANLAQFNAGINTATKELETFGQHTLRIAGQNREALQALGMGMTGFGVVTVAGLGMAVKTFADFESAMKNVQAISNATQAEFVQLSDYAQKLGKDTVFSSKQAAEALYYMASAGYSVKDQMAATDSVLKLATATQWGLSQSAEFTATTITSFGLKASDAGRVVDVMAKATAMSQATMEKLGYALPYVATQAHQLGMSLETTTAALSLLYDGGLKGEMAGERLRGALNTLLDPTDKETKALERMGITIDQVSPATNTLSDIVKVFESHVKMVGDAQFNAANATKIFGDRAEGMTVLVGQGSAKLIEYENNLKNSAGAAQKMADIQQQALSKSFEQLKGSVENLLIKMGGQLAPTVKDVTKLLENFTDSIAGMDPTLQTGLTNLTALAGGIGAITAAGLFFLTKLPDLRAGIAVLSAMGLSFKLAFAEVSIILTAIAVAVTLYQSAMKQTEEPNNKAILKLHELNSATTMLKEAYEILATKGIDTTNMTLGEFQKSTQSAKEAIHQLIPALGQSYDENVKMSTILKDVGLKTAEFTKGLNTEGEGIKATLPVIKEFGQAHTDTVKAVVGAAGATDDLGNKVKTLADQITGEYGTAWREANKLNTDMVASTHTLTTAVDENGITIRKWVENARPSVAGLGKTVEETNQAFIDTFSTLKIEGFRSLEVIAGAYAGLLDTNKQAIGELESIRSQAIPRIRAAEQKAYDDLINDAIVFWSKKIEIDRKFQGEIAAFAGTALEQRNADIEKADEIQFAKDLVYWQEQAKITEEATAKEAAVYDSHYDKLYGEASQFQNNSLKASREYYSEHEAITEQAISTERALVNYNRLTGPSPVKTAEEQAYYDRMYLPLNASVYGGNEIIATPSVTNLSTQPTLSNNSLQTYLATQSVPSVNNLANSGQSILDSSSIVGALMNVNTTISDKVGLTNSKLDVLINMKNSTPSVNQAAIDTITDLVLASARRRNVI